MGCRPVIKMKTSRKMTGLTTKGKVLLACVAVIVTAFAALVFVTDSEGGAESWSDMAISYYPGEIGVTTVDASGTSTGVAATVIEIDTYSGIKSTEYNPEFWKGTGEVSSSTPNWQGPSTTVYWNGDSSDDEVEVDLTFTFTPPSNKATGTYNVTIPGIKRIVSVTQVSPATTPTITIDGTTFSYTGTGTATRVLTVTVVYDNAVTVNKVFAGWKEKTYSISYNPGVDASGEMPLVNIIGGELNRYMLPECQFIAPDGQKFIGWTVSGMDGLQQPGTRIAVGSALTITANWDTGSGVEFAKNDAGATGVMAPVKKSGSYTVPFCFYVCNGKVFKGWSLVESPGEDDTIYQPGDSVNVEGEIVLYAQWGSYVAEECHSITFSSGKGLTNAYNAGTDTKTVNVLKGSNGWVLPSSSLFSSPSGKEFRAWSVRVGGGEPILMYPGEVVKLTESDLATGVKITALWRENVIYPGDVIDGNVTELEAQWVVPNLFITKSLSFGSNAWTGNTSLTLNNANLIRLDGYKINPYRAIDWSDSFSGGLVIDDSAYHRNTGYVDSVFSTINCLMTTKEYGMTGSTILKTGTYRTVNPYTNTGVYSDKNNYANSKANINFYKNTILAQGDVIFDNINYIGNNNGKHGDGTSGLFANGHRLIIGVNVTNPKFEGTDLSEDAKIDARNLGVNLLTIYGGKNVDSTEIVDCRKMVFGRDDVDMDEMVDLGSYLIIHSGIYLNVIGGCGDNKSMGNSSVLLSTYLVMKGGIVTDTLVGGCGGNGVLWGANTNSSTPLSSLKKECGGTFTYLTGVYTLGDYWQDEISGFRTDNGASNLREHIWTCESSIVEGGCSKSVLHGSSHMFVSGRASVWDVQAGGRSAATSTDYAYLEITGHAEVRRLACGTITDGNDSGSNKNSVRHANVYVGGDALVASVYGAGFDTWAYPKNESMTSGIVDVEIAGGTIYDVYGGGYRGSIGTKGTPSNLTVNVSMTGGEVLGNVYGGGSGGLNKIKHEVDGTGFQTNLDGLKGSTGRSYVYGNVNVTVSGGIVNGNVYGGGMSVPKMLTYDNVYSGDYGSRTTFTFSDEKEDNGKNNQVPCAVAAVEGNIVVLVTGNATVKGSVFGAGKGISLKSDGTVDDNEYGFNMAIYNKGNGVREIGRMPWAASSGTQNVYDNSSKYLGYYDDYAKILGTTSVTIESNDWSNGRATVSDGTYEVSRYDADAGKHIVLYDTSNVVAGYTLIMIDGSEVRSVLTRLADGDEIDLDLSSYWYVKGEVQEDAYEVDPDDVLSGNIIVMYHNASEPSAYTVILLDGEEAKVVTNRAEGSSIAVGAFVYGSVYGGGGYSRVYGSTYIESNSGKVNTNIFGGGLGTANKISTEGSRAVFITGNSVISGSVFGGSEYGIDGVPFDVNYSDISQADKDKLHKARATIIVQQATIKGSVFGGGLMGKTYGDTEVYIGYGITNSNVNNIVPNDYSTLTGLVVSVSSVFAGGNISTGDSDTTVTDAYTEYLVQGTGLIRVFGSNGGSIDITDSIMGSGNACLTRGDTDVELSSVYGISAMNAIHRVTTLTIDNSVLKINGRSPITPIFGQDKPVSVYKIGTLILKNGASIAFDAPMDDIGELKSYTKEGRPTTETSPQNRVVFTQGSTIYVRSEKDGNPSYNTIEGFVLMVATGSGYGAYAIGSVSPNGGFSVSSEGSVREADTSVSDNISCWYISGIEKKVAIFSLNVADSSRGLVCDDKYVKITKFQPDTYIIFTGGIFTKMSNDPDGDPYTFVRPGAESMEDNPSQLGLAIGYKGSSSSEDDVILYDPTYRMMAIAGESMASQQGTFFKKDGMESDINGENRNRSLTSVPMLYSSGEGTNGEFRINMCLSGRPLDGTAYVGYLTLNFQEVKLVSYEAVGDGGDIVDTPKALVANTIEVRVDIYIYGSGASGTSDSYSVEIRTDTDSNGYRSGESTTLIPQSYNLAELRLSSVAQIGAGSGIMPDIYVSDGDELPECGFIAPEGKAFDYWKISSGEEDISGKPGDIVDITDSTLTIGGEYLTIVGNRITITPVWTTMMEIVYDLNGGSGSLSSVAVGSGTTFILPDADGISTPSEDVWFAGWIVIVGSNKAIEKHPGDTVVITGDTIIKAYWNDLKTISFEKNGGLGLMDPVSWALNEKYTMPECGFTLAGNYFLYWSVSIDGGSAIIKYPGDIVKITGNVIATAVWSSSVNVCTVTYNSGGGTGTMSPVTLALGSKYCLPSCDFGSPNPSTKMFFAWSIASGSGVEFTYNPGEFVTITNNTVVRAVWESKEEILFGQGGGGGGMDPDYKAYGQLYEIPYPDGITPPTGKVFYRWVFDDGVSTTYYYPGQQVTIDGILLLTADWIEPSKLCFRVSFEAEGGSGYMPILKKMSGDTYNLPNCDYVAPSNKVFAKWLVNGSENDPGEPISIYQDIIVKPKWVDVTTTDPGKDCTISVKTGITSDSVVLTKVANGSVFMPPNGITKDGSVFSGWSLPASGYDSDTHVVTSDITFIAQWDTGTVVADYEDGAIVKEGKVVITAKSNQDNTSGWSNIGNSIVWDLSKGKLINDSNYIGTLLGNIVGNISFKVEDLKYVDSGGTVYTPKLDIKFLRTSYGESTEAHTYLTFSDKQYYSVNFVDHGIVTNIQYPENTRLTYDLCESPSGNNFNGWYLDSQYINRYDYNMVVNDESDGMYLYARYTYTVILDNMNGTSYTLYVSQEDKGAMLGKSDLPIPVYEGFDFAGWCKDKDCIYDWAYQSDKVTEDITLYARWVGKEVRVYFWYMDGNAWKLFSGSSTGIVPVNDKYDLSQAYMLNSSNGIFTTVTYGSTFDVKDPYHSDGTKSILKYAEDTLESVFEGSFVRWITKTPSGSYVSVYEDTVLNTSILNYVTDDMLKNYNGIWDYYLHMDGGYPRIDWPTSDKPTTMEIHLVAETTNVAIKVTMGLKSEDEEFASTISIDDPESFLVYPNGPDMNRPGPEDGTYYGEDGELYSPATDNNGVNYYYRNGDTNIRYYKDTTDNCWCYAESNLLSDEISIGYPGGQGSGPYSGYINEYGIVFLPAKGKDYGLKTIAYKEEDGVETEYLVEWNVGDGGQVNVRYHLSSATSGQRIYNQREDLQGADKLGYYVKIGDCRFYVTKVDPTFEKGGNTDKQWAERQFQRLHLSVDGKSYEFVYKLNSAVRSGYTLIGWHNDYVSIDNALNPSPDILRKVLITIDSLGHVNTAKLISKDSDGTDIVKPLLVGDYVVDPKDADAEGTIVVRAVDGSVIPEGMYSTFEVKIDATTTSGHPEGKSIGLTVASGSGEFVGWKIKDRIISQYEYTVSSYYADVEGNITIVADSSHGEHDSFTVKLLNEDGSVKGTELKTAGQFISLTGDYAPPTGYEWRVKDRSVTEETYTVLRGDADAEGVIILKLSKQSAERVSAYRIIVVDGESRYYLPGEHAAGQTVSLGAPYYDGYLWRIGDSDVVGYTVSSKDADASGLILLKTYRVATISYTVKTNVDGTVNDLGSHELGSTVTLDFLDDKHSGNNTYVFLGWKARSGELIDRYYTLSVQDVGSDGYITLVALWENSIGSNYNIRYVTEIGTLTGTIDVSRAAGSTISSPTVSASGYKFIGWQPVSNPAKTVTGTTYIVKAEDSDSQHYIVLKAVWSRIYHIKVENADPIDRLEGETVVLTYASSNSKWRVSGDIRTEGGKVTPGGEQFVSTYRALWDQLDYSVNLTEPANGHIDFYLEDEHEPGKSIYLEESEVNSMVFHYGDKIKITYTPNSSKVSFVKWIITGQYQISDTGGQSAILIVQGNCSIAVDESTGTVVDIVIAFDDKNLNAEDRKYTRVFMHDKDSDEYYEAKYIPGMVKQEHYTVKVPYGDYYEVCVAYGWSLPAADGTCDVLETYEDGYEMYSLSGEIPVRVNADNYFVFEVISAGFINHIPADVTLYADSEYGPLIYDESSAISKFLMNPDGSIKSTSRSSDLYEGYRFANPPSGRNPTRIIDTNGTDTPYDDKVVVKVSKYVGILRSNLEVLKARNLAINNPLETPPVVVTFYPNQTYKIYEGFPYIDSASRNVFTIATNVNIKVDGNSNDDSRKTFYLNWERTDSPADIIIQVSPTQPPDNFVTIDTKIQQDKGTGYDDLVSGIKFDLGNETAGYYIKQYQLDTIEGYNISYEITAGSVGTGGGVHVTSDNKLYIKVNSTNYDNNLEIVVKYNRGTAYYTFNNNTFGYNPITGYNPAVPEVNYSNWGTTIDLPDYFIWHSTQKPITGWWVQETDGNGHYIEKGADTHFHYDVTKADAISTGPFRFYVGSGDATYSLKFYSDSEKTILVYQMKDDDTIYDSIGKRVHVMLYKDNTCTEICKHDDYEDTAFTDNRLLFVPLATSESITMSFVTHNQTFSNGYQRLTIEMTSGGTMKEYVDALTDFSLVIDFIAMYSSGDGTYLFDGFYCNGTKFNPNEDTIRLTQDMIFIAEWEADPTKLKVFIHSQDGDKASVSALRDASTDTTLPRDTPNKLMTDTEITISIQPSSGYTIDIEKTRGEMGYELVSTETYVDITVPEQPEFFGKSFRSWKLWNSGLAIGAETSVTESLNNAKRGFLVFVADYGEIHSEEFTIVYVTKTGIVPTVGYSNDGQLLILPEGDWKLWGSGSTISETWTVSSSYAENGFIVFVKDGTALSEVTVVYASEFGVTEVAESKIPYYTDSKGSRYLKTNVTTVYRYEDGWKQYDVKDISGQDGNFIVQYSTHVSPSADVSDVSVYKSTRDGVFYKKTACETFTVSDGTSDGFAKKLIGSVTYYVDDNGTIYASDKTSIINIRFFKDNELLTKAVESSDYVIGNTVYHPTFTECDAAPLGFFTREIVTGELTYYSDQACTEEATGSEPIVYAKDVYNTKSMYMKEGSYYYLLKFYSSEYDCIETSYLHYDGSVYNGNQFKDVLGTVWIKNTTTGVFSVHSAVVYSFNPTTNVETSQVITYYDGTPSPAYPAMFYFKDNYGNHIVGNYLDNKLEVGTLYLKKGDDIETLTVKYIEYNEYIKALFKPGNTSDNPDYYITKNGKLINNDSGKTEVDGTLYHHKSGEVCSEEYRGDYSIVMVSTKYTNRSEVRENGTVFYKDTFGNKYSDWLGTPTQLTGTRGFIWTFFLKDSLDLTIYTKKVSYNINFIINGVKVTQTDMNRVSTVSTLTYAEGNVPDHSHEYYGTDIPQYSIVAFDGPQGDRGITWYTDPLYQNEYDVKNNRALISPDNFMVDLILPEKPVSAGKTFEGWQLWGTDTEYEAYDSVIIDNPHDTHKGGIDNNYFVYVADWDTGSSAGIYTVVYATTYGSVHIGDNGNMFRTSDSSITLISVPTVTGKVCSGWKVWGTGSTIPAGQSITLTDVEEGKFILLVADWGEDNSKANNVVYASEFGNVPNMESIRKYQYLSTRNISLYAHTGTYILYLHNFYDDDTKTIKYEMESDEYNQITIPDDHYGLEGYLFIGWSVPGDNGKRDYVYVPGEHIYVSALNEYRIDLYPFFMSDGSSVKYYDGNPTVLQISLDSLLSEYQNNPVGSILEAVYSQDHIPTDLDDPEASDEPIGGGTHVGEGYSVFYYAEIKTPLGLDPSDPSYGNSETHYVFKGQATLGILPVDAYAIAPSIIIREGDGTITSAEVEGDIVLVGLVDGEYTVTLKTDEGYGDSRTTPGTTPTRVVITWTSYHDANIHHEEDYNLSYIDGTLTIYAEDTSKHEFVGYS